MFYCIREQIKNFLKKTLEAIIFFIVMTSPWIAEAIFNWIDGK